MEIDYGVVISNIRLLLNSHETTIDQFCKDTGMYSGTAYRYMSSVRKPSLEFVVAISQYFNVDLEWLLGLPEARKVQVSNESQQIAECFALAGDSDKQVVHAILDRYQNSAKTELA